MKRYVQDPGGRKVKGDDLIAIQAVALMAESFLSGYGNFIISGCNVNGNAISSGIVMLNGKACIFEGLPSITLPFYVKYNMVTENVPYKSGTETGRGYEIYQAIQAAATDTGAFRLDNADRFADIFKPKKAGDAATLGGFAASYFPKTITVTDWNNITCKGGDILIGTIDAANRPSANYFTAIALPSSNNPLYLKLIGLDSIAACYTRSQVNGVWSGWGRLITAEPSGDIVAFKTS